MAVVHSTFPDALTAVVDEVLRAGGVEHRAHGPAAPVRAAETAAGDAAAVALIGPFASGGVGEAVEATAPGGPPLRARGGRGGGGARAGGPAADRAGGGVGGRHAPRRAGLRRRG